MVDVSSQELIKLAHLIDKISNPVLNPLGISYFQFKRTYQNIPKIILANNLVFFHEFIKDDLIEPQMSEPLSARQKHFCFWDETLSEEKLEQLRRNLGLYHGFTILNRYKEYYDCVSFARNGPSPTPVATYLYSINVLQDFGEQFPLKAKSLIKEATENPLRKATPISNHKHNPFFLPKRSVRFYLGNDTQIYITSYEALCVQLTQQGKTYKEIGKILSIGSGTVKTLLHRLKERTGLSLEEISLQLLHAYYARKFIKNLGNGEQDSHFKNKTTNAIDSLNKGL